MYAEASATLFREIIHCLDMYDYVQIPKCAAGSIVPRILYDKKTNKAFKMLYEPNLAKRRCFST